MVTAWSFEIKSDKINIIRISARRNYEQKQLIIKLQFLLVSSHILKHLKDSRYHKFFLECLVLKGISTRDPKGYIWHLLQTQGHLTTVLLLLEVIFMPNFLSNLVCSKCIISSPSSPSMWLLSKSFPHHKSVCISWLPALATYPTHHDHLYFNNCNNSRGPLQFTEFLTVLKSTLQ